MMAAALPANPYPGLRAFEPDENEFFFGRERETDELRRRLRSSRLLAVIGSSGSGKSSLVRSGLIPSLHAGFMAGAGSSWRVAITRPGEAPIGQLADALDSPGVLGTETLHADTRRTVLEVMLRDSSLGLAEAVRQAQLPAGENVLVVVDQFEELFRYRRSRPVAATGDDAVAFIRLLLEAARCPDLPIYIVLTMRSEFIGECAAFDSLPEAINAGQYLVPRMSRDALRAAISGPATVRGVVIAPRLLVRLLNEVGDDLDRLPVLQHALMRTWDAWAKHPAPGVPIDVSHYEAIGTMRQALSRHAEETYAELGSERERGIAEQLFKALTETTEDGHGIRRPIAFRYLSELCATSPTEVEGVVDRFRAPGRAFLQPAAGIRLEREPERIVDLTHESLMRLWGRLAGWVEEEARAEDIFRRLSRSAVQHDAGEASLWRPPELTLGLRWLRENRPSASWVGGDPARFEQVMRFLRLSRRVHRLKLGMAVAGIALAVALAIGWFARDAQRQRAEAQRQLAIAEENSEEAKRLKAEVERLQGAADTAVAARNAQLQEVLKLSERHGALQAEVNSLQRSGAEVKAATMSLRVANVVLGTEVRRLGVENSRLDLAVSGLRDEVQALENRLRELAAELARLQERRQALEDAYGQLLQEASNLADSTGRLRSLAPLLQAQSADLDKQLAALRARYQQLQTLKQENEPCPPSDKIRQAAAIGWASPSPIGVLPMPQASPMPLGSPTSGAAAAPVAAGAAGSPAKSDAAFEDQERDRLRRLIRELSAQLASFTQEKSSLEEDATRLRQQNALLERQRDALKRELVLLDAERTALQQENTRLDLQRERLRQENVSLQKESAALGYKRNGLQWAAERAKAKNQALSARVAANEERNARKGNEVEAARQEQQDQDRLVGELADAITTARRKAEQLDADNQRLASEMTITVEQLVKAAGRAQVPEQLAALLALKAWRWAPYDSDNPLHPAVYNTLWRVLNRLDGAAARSLIAPSEQQTAKLATARSEDLVQALCRRVTRPLTEAEWQRFMPKGACYTDKTANPCAP